MAYCVHRNKNDSRKLIGNGTGSGRNRRAEGSAWPTIAAFQVHIVRKANDPCLKRLISSFVRSCTWPGRHVHTKWRRRGFDSRLTVGRQRMD